MINDVEINPLWNNSAVLDKSNIIVNINQQCFWYTERSSSLTCELSPLLSEILYIFTTENYHY